MADANACVALWAMAACLGNGARFADYFAERPQTMRYLASVFARLPPNLFGAEKGDR